MNDRELMQMALDALELCDPVRVEKEVEALRARLEQNEFNPDWDAMAVMVEEQQRMAKRIEELEARLAQPEPKQVTFGVNALPKMEREWQGLTDETEIKHCWYEACQTDLELTSQLVGYFARAIEAKLKEKNT